MTLKGHAMEPLLNKKNTLTLAFALAATLFGTAAIAAYSSEKNREASFDAIDTVTLKETYDIRASFPKAPPADVTGFTVSFKGYARGEKGSGIVIRNIEIPCNVFLGWGVDENISRTTSGFGLNLSSE